MLIRKRIINPAPEREVVVVKPRQPTGLFTALGLGTLCALGLTAYLAWAVPQADRTDYGTKAVIVDDNAGRAQRIAPKPAAPPPTVIINPPPIVHTPPPVIVKPPERTIIVEGSSEPEPVAPKPLRRDQTNNDRNTSGDEDVDGTIKGG